MRNGHFDGIARTAAALLIAALTLPLALSGCLKAGERLSRYFPGSSDFCPSVPELVPSAWPDSFEEWSG